jgi:immune inhibitor A
MKRISLLVFFLIINIVTIHAAKAFNVPITITQPDGMELTVINHGDEDLHWYTTTDGVILYHSGSYFYIAAIDDNGNMTSTSQLAHESGQRNATEQALIALQNKNKFYSSFKTTSLKAAMRREPLNTTSSPSYFPHTGSPKAVVILVNFADTTFYLSNPKTVFDEFLNGEAYNGHIEYTNYGSVRQYFKDMSFGNFTPQFDIYGPYTLSKNMAYYGANQGKTEDVNFESIISDACTLADTDVNFANYDADGDGYVDLVYIIYAGYGESNGGSSNTIWPKSGAYDSGTYDGKKVSRYGLNNELNMYPAFYTKKNINPKINGIGLFCHEFSHTLGMPDIYPTDTLAYVNNQEMEYWDLMDGGEYVNRGYCPAPYTAWERETLGWYKLDTLSVSKKNIVISPVSDGGKAYRFLNDQNNNEYMILEDIQNTGWSYNLPGHGLLVYHVKWPRTTVSMYDHPNNVAGKPGMAIVPADGQLLSSYLTTSLSQYLKAQGGDVFPGTSNITALNDTMNLPNFVWYNSDSTTRKVNLALNNITEDTSIGITFDYIDDFATGIKDITSFSENHDDDRIYTIDGRYAGRDKETLPKGIYIKNKKKFIIK